jgi:hypothetical protein
MTAFDPSPLQMLRDPQITSRERRQLASRLTEEQLETAFDQDLLTVDDVLNAQAGR